MSLLSVVIPCHNEEANIHPLTKAFSDLKLKDLELIFVDDGSSDNTLSELKKLQPTFASLKIISFSRNFGKEAAMYAGFESATGDFVAILDADLQQPPALLLEMLDALKKDPSLDAVCFYQSHRKEAKFTTFCKRRFYRLIAKLSGMDFVNGASDFRMFRRPVVDAVLSLGERTRFSKGIFNWVGFNTKYLPYTPAPRAHGKSNFSFRKLLGLAVDGIFSFSVLPLRFATALGFVFSIVAFVYFVVVFIQKIFFTIDIPGYATLVMSLMLIGGAILLSLGIIGEYISRIYIEVKARPIYLVKYRNAKKKTKNA